jgi:DNA-binding IclR family transcriptional regulator
MRETDIYDVIKTKYLSNQSCSLTDLRRHTGLHPQILNRSLRKMQGRGLLDYQDNNFVPKISALEFPKPCSTKPRTWVFGGE